MHVENILQSKGHAVVTVAARATIAEAVDLLNARRIGAVVVTDNGRVAGILSERDIVRHLDGLIHGRNDERDKMSCDRFGRDFLPLQALQLDLNEPYNLFCQRCGGGHQVDLRVFVMFRFTQQIGCDMRRLRIVVRHPQ